MKTKISKTGIGKEPMFTATELSERWEGKVAAGTINNWRYLKKKKGPKPTKIEGKIFYLLSNVEKYEAKKSS